MSTSEQQITPEQAVSKPKRGILLVAMGNKEYGRMALNLCLSIKANGNIPVAVVHDGAISTLTEQEKKQFDKRIECPAEYYGKNDYFRIKLLLDKLTPFDETIYMDADCLVLPGNDITKHFDSINNVDLTYENRGFIDALAPDAEKGYWVQIADVVKAYNIVSGKHKYYSLHSEFIVWRKSKITTKYFETALEIYDHPKVEAKKFANGLPDEFAFSIASMILEIYPHKDNYLPGYWYPAEQAHYKSGQLFQLFDFMSMGGNRLPQFVIEQYDNLVKYYAQKNGLNVYKFKNKASYLTERALI